MSNFWIGFIIGGFICALIGFLGAAILAASGRASRMEEKIEETLIFKSKDPKDFSLTKPGLPLLPDFPVDDDEILSFKSKKMKPYKNFDDKKDAYMVVTQNDPRTD